MQEVTLQDLNQIEIPEEFKEYVKVVQTEMQPDGWLWERVYLEFPNGYGASVINSKYEVGMIEVAVFYDGHLCYSSPITSDVIRLYDYKVEHLIDRKNGETFNSLLNRIKLLEG